MNTLETIQAAREDGDDTLFRALCTLEGDVEPDVFEFLIDSFNDPSFGLYSEVAARLEDARDSGGCDYKFVALWVGWSIAQADLENAE